MPFNGYPFQSHTLDVGGLNLHYVDEGPADAEPVLMVHGNPTWSYYYRNLVSALKDRYRTIAPDHIGMGLSDKPADAIYPYTLGRRVDDLEMLLDKLNLSRPLTLVLHDWGGMIGMALATRRPERIARLVVLNTSAFGLPPGKRMPWQLSLARTPLLGALLVRGLNAFSAGAARDCVMRALPPEVREAYLAPYNSWHNRIAVHRFIQDIPLHPGDPAFGIVAEVERKLPLFQAIPMLICWGMNDFVFDVHFLNRWIELFPRAQMHRFDDAGHYVLEDAGERIVPLVRTFLEAHPL